MNEQATSRRAVRVVLVSAAGVLRDIVRGVLEAERVVTVVTEIPDPTTLERTLRRTPADVLVIWLVDGGGQPDGLPDIFAVHPRIKVLTVVDEGRHGVLWMLRPHPCAIGELTPDLLAAAVREALTPYAPVTP